MPASCHSGESNTAWSIGFGLVRPMPKLMRLVDVVGDHRHARLDVLVLEVDARRHVAAADVEADAGDRHMVFVGDHAADRLRIAEVAVGAQHAAGHAADAHAAPHLRDGALVMVAVDLEFSHDTLLSFRVLHISGWSAHGCEPAGFSGLQGLWDSRGRQQRSAVLEVGEVVSGRPQERSGLSLFSRQLPLVDGADDLPLAARPGAAPRSTTSTASAARCATRSATTMRGSRNGPAWATRSRPAAAPPSRTGTSSPRRPASCARRATTRPASASCSRSRSAAWTSTPSR